MIPGADHSSRWLVFRRICSWSEVAANSANSMPPDEGNNNDSNDTLRRPLLRLTSSFLDSDGNEIEISNTDHNDDLTSLLLCQHVPSLEYEERSENCSLGGNHGGEENSKKRTDWKLWIVFCFLVASGVGNVIFAKLQSLPMYVRCSTRMLCCVVLLIVCVSLYICLAQTHICFLPTVISLIQYVDALSPPFQSVSTKTIIANPANTCIYWIH